MALLVHDRRSHYCTKIVVKCVITWKNLYLIFKMAILLHFLHLLIVLIGVYSFSVL